MAKIIDFNNFQNEEPDLEQMNREELTAYLEQLQSLIAQLDADEPADMESEAYEEWGDRHELLEDLVDEVMDRLEAL